MPKYKQGRQSEIPDELRVSDALGKNGDPSKLWEPHEPPKESTERKVSSTPPSVDTFVFPVGDGYEVNRGDTNAEGKHTHFYRKVLEDGKPIVKP